MISIPLRILFGFCLICTPLHAAFAQNPRPTAARPGAPRPGLRPPPPAPPPRAIPGQPMRKASEMIRRQDPIVVNQGTYERLTSDSSRVVVSISKQRAYLLAGDEIAIDTPISSGKRAGMTPKGDFKIMQKDKDHRSNIYGDFKDRSGRTVRGGVSVRIDSAPSGTHFVGAPMKWFMRLTGDGVGMHVGILPGYPASHGCIRMPPQSAEMFFNRVKIGTPVEVTP